VSEVFTFAATARKRFEIGDNSTRRQILTNLGSHFTLLDGKLRIDNPLPFLTIKKMKNEAPILGDMFAPDKQGDTATKKDALFASFPALLRGLEEIRTYYTSI
jgi:hypothetical protein